MGEPKLAEKSWSVELEQKAFERHRRRAYEPTFESARRETGPLFVIDTPPPYPSGRWHIGAVAHYALIDVIARSRRMMGERVLFPWGLDRNGINIELVVEKKYKKRMREWPRAEFLDLCRKEIEENSRSLAAIAQRIGMSCDFGGAYATDSPEYRAASQRAFIELWRKGAILEDLRPNNYCPDCGTTIADAEVLREDAQSRLVHVRWDHDAPLPGDGLVIATTRPELIAACQLLLVHPDDERYAALVRAGATATLPVYGRKVPIKADPSVETGFGTGAMMICSYGDFADVANFRKFGLAPVDAIGPDGKMTERAGPLAGLRVKAARERMLELLRSEGRIVKEEPVQQKVPICERSRTPIEIINLKEWYVKQASEAESLRAIAQTIQFHPAKHRQILLDWIDTLTIDWPISRRRYYHTEIPIWYCGSCRTPHVPHGDRYYQPWKEPAPPEIAEKGCRACGARGAGAFVGEEKVFDTWMDSSISNLYVTHWHNDPDFFARNFPTTLRPQGRDIVRTWLHYTALKSHLLFDRPAFSHAWITGLGMDEQGRKMSKSLGNVIDPDEILSQHGSDALRFWIASECTIGDDYRISRDRIQGAKKFLSKLYNVSRFVSSFEEAPRPERLAPWDAWILAELNRTIDEALAGYAAYDFFRAANGVRGFVWNLFAPHYLEMVKKRAYEGDPSTLYTLHACHRAALALLAPITPLFADTVWDGVYGGDAHAQRFPRPVEGVPDEALKATEPIVAFNSEVWKRKKEANLPLNAPIAGVPVPPELAAFARVLGEMHTLQ